MSEEIPEKDTLEEPAAGEGRPAEPPADAAAGESGEGAAGQAAEPAAEATDERPDEEWRSRFQSADARKADVLNRAIARLIDVLIALLLARFPGYAGFTLGLVYLGIADGLFSGASVGKRIIGLRVVKYPHDGIVSYRDSILRNSTLCVLYAALWIPIVGWVVAIAGAGFEFLLMLGSPEGKRLGDEIASTVVLDDGRTARQKSGANEGAGANEGTGANERA